MSKIISYNVNGLRAAVRNGFLTWLQAAKPDVLCLQEIKADASQIDQQPFLDLGYHLHWYPAKRKGYSGVAIFSLEEPETIINGTGNTIFDEEGRIIQANFADWTVLSVYVPAGSDPDRQTYKMAFLQHLKGHIQTLLRKGKPLILAGDWNICPEAKDLHNPDLSVYSSGFLPEERSWMADFLDLGLVDSFRAVNSDPHHYTWWSYRHGARERNLGWRIDHIHISTALSDRIKRAAILSRARHSDHCPCLLELH